MNIRYIQIEVGFYDGEVKSLPAGCKGPYSALLWHLISHDGWIENDMEKIANLCGVLPVEMPAIWPRCVQFLNKVGGKYFHKRMRGDIKRAIILSQRRSIAGLTGNDLRWHSDGKAIAQRGVKGKGSKVKEDLPSSAQIPIPSLSLARELHTIIHAKSNSDWRAYEEVARQFSGRWQEVLEIARRSKGMKKPIAYFFTVLKKEMGYIRQSRGGTGFVGDLANQILSKVKVQNAG
jgi:uncharacterized protein YdaU (DUF1376 family)